MIAPEYVGRKALESDGADFASRPQARPRYVQDSTDGTYKDVPSGRTGADAAGSGETEGPARRPARKKKSGSESKTKRASAVAAFEMARALVRKHSHQHDRIELNNATPPSLRAFLDDQHITWAQVADGEITQAEWVKRWQNGQPSA